MAKFVDIYNLLNGVIGIGTGARIPRGEALKNFPVDRLDAATKNLATGDKPFIAIVPTGTPEPKGFESLPWVKMVRKPVKVKKIPPRPDWESPHKTPGLDKKQQEMAEQRLEDQKPKIKFERREEATETATEGEKPQEVGVDSSAPASSSEEAVVTEPVKEPAPVSEGIPDESWKAVDIIKYCTQNKIRFTGSKSKENCLKHIRSFHGIE